MSRFSVSPELLFDRPWRAGHPFRPHCGRARRLVTIVALVILCLLIAGYSYLTDSNRVREMAQSYLTRLVGGRVEVGSARLSIFEGLRLENVRVHVDDAGDAPDSVIFSAHAIVVSYNPRSMLVGQLEATQIIAERPKLLIALDPAVNLWNYHRLGAVRHHQGRPIFSSRESGASLPEVLLRNARLELAEMHDGKLVERGEMFLDGQVRQSPDGQSCLFEVQSRGTKNIGPYVSGTVDLAHGGFAANLHNFEFGEDGDFGSDVRRMLPEAVRDWWQRHALAGHIDIPVVRYAPADTGGTPHFRVEMQFRPVTMSVGSEEWGGAPSPSAAPIQLQQVSGLLVFTENGIEVSDVTGRVEDIALCVNGRYEGYGPDAPFTLKVSSPATENLYIPPSPTYIDSFPKPVRDLYKAFQPQGTANVEVELTRTQPGQVPQVRGAMDVVDGNFVFKLFPYPVRHATGRLSFAPDPNSGYEMVYVQNIRGQGVEHGPNANSFVSINGSVGPLLPGVEQPVSDITVYGQHVTSEPALSNAFPPPVRQGISLLGADGADYPKYSGDFTTRVLHVQPIKGHWTFDTDVKLDDGNGALQGFPYPLEHVSGNIHVRDGYIDLDDMHMRRADETVHINGRVAWGTGFDPDLPIDLSARPGGKPLQTVLHVTVDRAPIDAALVQSLPPDKRRWLTALGVEGTLNVDGFVSQPSFSLVGKPPITAEQLLAAYPLKFDLNLHLRDGQLTPEGSKFTISSASADMHLSSDALTIAAASGTRHGGQLQLSGAVDWPAGPPRLALMASARDWPMDQEFHDALPASVQADWDLLRPTGTVDLDLSYRPATVAATAGTVPATQASAAPAFHLVIQPRQLSIKPALLPYPFEHLHGKLELHDQRVQIIGMTADHGAAHCSLDGTGEIGDRPRFSLDFAAKNLAVDRDLHDAVPPVVQSIIDSLKLTGPCDLRFSHLLYTAAAASPKSVSASVPNATTDATASTAPTAASTLSFNLGLTLHGGSIDVGVPIKNIQGSLSMDASLQDGAVSGLAGRFDVDSLSMAGRQLQHFTADLQRHDDGAGFKIANMQADLAGGQMAGDLDLLFPVDGSSRYSLKLAVRDADVKQLAQETDPTIQGDLTASLSLEGDWADPASRRGRGEVLVTGKEMYRIPLVLGLLQVTNLGLPIAQPFHRATVRYTLDGQRVNFDQIELRSDQMLMTGNGHLDFGTRQVRMTFTTDNANGLQLPVISDLLKGTRNELLKINVKGTITQPKVETSVMGTFTTTVDEVLKGDAKSPDESSK